MDRRPARCGEVDLLRRPGPVLHGHGPRAPAHDLPGLGPEPGPARAGEPRAPGRAPARAAHDPEPRRPRGPRPGPRRARGRGAYGLPLPGRRGAALRAAGRELPRPGCKSLGLTGRIGSGKSTVLRAIPRLLELAPDTLFVDGTPLERWDLADLRSGVGYVPQDGYVFSLSLGENVAFGAPDASPERVLQAAKVAELEKDLDQLDRGLETLIGERGVTLSGGQRQRLAIARAVLIEPPILLLDDALSMVDAETRCRSSRTCARPCRTWQLLVTAHGHAPRRGRAPGAPRGHGGRARRAG
ncbi:MAG: ABC transporter ATP-binding protein [Planctomycetota bacterium]